eukprot:PLAT13204.1.p1 GENE.PLAT13204.1~~PLAT13204.1.p1  ORF type:complete len:241 (+),score=35.84 PLAT13204.1:75-725(+)
MAAELPSCDFKIVLLGDKGVGKTCIVLRYVEGTFTKDTCSTIGAFFLTKKMTMDGYKVKLQIWDTAGQERFRAMAPMYYRGASAAILVFDITDESSFVVMKDWVEELMTNVPGGIVLGIACNKSDLTEERAVEYERAKSFAESIGAIIYETSAKTDSGIEELFMDISREVIRISVESGAAGRSASASDRRKLSLRDQRMGSYASASGKGSGSSCCS